MYIVKHNNPKHPDIIGGNEFAYDGVGENWSKKDAENFVLRAMYVARNINYEIILEEEINDNSDTVQSEPDNEEGSRKRRKRIKQ